MKNYNTLNEQGKESIKETLLTVLNEQYEEGEAISDLSELHNKAFNEDYFLIGYFQCEEWIKNHTEGVFSCIGAIQEFENDHFGEVNTKLDNSESVLNMFAYILGYEIVYDNLEDDLTVLECIEIIEEL